MRLANQPSSPLAVCRLAAGFTQEDFAEKLGADRSTIGRWERGTQCPQPWQRPYLARFLNISLEQLDDILRRTKHTVSAVPGAHLVAARATQSRDMSPATVDTARQNDSAALLGVLGNGSLLAADPGQSVIGLGQDITLRAAPGRFFSGTGISAGLYPAVDDGRIVTTVPAGVGGESVCRQPGRSLVIGALDDDATAARFFGLDGRHVRRRLRNTPGPGRMLMPRAYLLDDLTVGLLWAVSNLDEALLDDDAALAVGRDHIAVYEQLPRSAVGRDVASDLSPVSAMWLGSDFCARHILRHADTLADVPRFWTREQRGEEACTWLLFAHKYAYLRQSAARFGATGTSLTRAFCLPPGSVQASSRPERILLLLTAALMESFGIGVDVCVEPEYASVQGFVFDQHQQAIVANWVGAEGIWQVDLTDSGSLLREFADAVGYAQAHSVVAGRDPATHLAALAEYLDLDWDWFIRRCSELAAYGSAGLVAPRSRLLSVAGIDQACCFLAGIAQHADP